MTSNNRFLVVFDVDSTLIRDEVIELLADVAGKRSEVAAVTERAMAGELDFAESLVLRVNTLAGLPESVFGETLAKIQITDGVPELIDAIHERGGLVGAVSGGFSQLLDPLARTLNLDFHRANNLEVVEGTLTGRVTGQIVDRAVKDEMLRLWAAEANLGLAQCIAVGDGANDLAMMKSAGLSVAFNAKPIVRRAADIVLAGSNLGALEALLP